MGKGLNFSVPVAKPVEPDDVFFEKDTGERVIVEGVFDNGRRVCFRSPKQSLRAAKYEPTAIFLARYVRR